MNVFRVMRDHGERLKRALELTPFARDEFSLSYQASDDPLEQARRTVVRSFMGFGSAAATGENSGFRSNSNRSGTTPAHDWQNYAGALPMLVERLQGVVIENRDALDLMAHHDAKTTLHYCDPPYVHSTRSSKMRGVRGQGQCSGRAYRYELDDEGHRRFAQTVRGLQGMVVVSGYDCPLYADLFGDWERFARTAYADGARERKEVLWISPSCSQALHRSRADLFSELGDLA